MYRTRQVKFTLVFLASCIGSMFLHEIGHAIFGCFQGVPVVPTLAKEYVVLPEVDWHERTWISLGGVFASVLITSGALLWHILDRNRKAAAALAGCLILPGCYSLRFLIAGRGHDGTEWQEAQTALGASPSGHFLDLLFLVLLLAGGASLVWFKDISFGWRSLLKSAGLLLAALMMIVMIQVGNNALFDKHFPKTRTLNMPVDMKSD